MKIVLNQSEIGKFNFIGNEESLAFSLRFVNDDGSTVKVNKQGLVDADESLNTESAVFRVNSDADENLEWRKEYLEELYFDRNWEALLLEHKKHSQFSYTSGLGYREQRYMFAKFIEEHFIEIENSLDKQEIEGDKKRIEELERELASLKAKNYYSASEDDAPRLKDLVVQELNKDAQLRRKWQSEYKKTSDKYKEYQKKIDESEQLIMSLGYAVIR